MPRKSGIVIEPLSGYGLILNRNLAWRYRRLLTESAGEGGIGLRMHARNVSLRAVSVCGGPAASGFP
jgi:hypothetical protein